MLTLAQKEAQFVADLAEYDNWTDKFNRIAEYGEDLPAYPEEYSYSRFIVGVEGCVSTNYWVVGHSSTSIYVRGKSNAVIPKGLMGVLHYIYDSQPMASVENFTPTFIETTGLNNALSAPRLALLRELIKRINDYAHGVPMVDAPTPQEEFNRQDIVALKTRMTTAEANITAHTTVIATETSNRQTADAALQTNIDTEETARQTADATLQSGINSEASTRQTADAALQTAVNNEVAARQTADATLQTAVNNEVAQRQAADTALQSNITTEATQRQSADATLQTNINNEAAARQTADARIEGKVDALTPAQQGLAGQVLTIGEDGTSKIWKTPDIGGIEDVTVQLSVEDGGASVAGVNVAVQVEGENQLRQYVSDAQGKVNFTVHFGLQYTVYFGSIEGYMPITSPTYRASLLTRIVYGTYREDASQTQEQVTIAFTYTSGSASRAAAVNVQTNTGTTIYPIVNDQCTFGVPLGTAYTIKFESVDGYATPANQSFVATFRGRSVKAYYVGAVLGLVWVKQSDGTTIAFEDLTMENAAGIVGLRISTSNLAQQSASFLVPMEYLLTSNVVSEGQTIITAKSIGSKTWGPQTLLENLPCYTSASAATTPDNYYNLDGQNNTNVYLAEAAEKGLTLPAMEATRAISYTINGVEKLGFLGSYAQMKAFADSYNDIQAVVRSMLGVNVITIRSGGWWTSTQYSQTYAVHLYNGGFLGYFKANDGSVVPFLAY